MPWINKKNFDWVLLGLLLALMVTGLIIIYTASSTKIGDVFTIKDYFFKQVLFAVAAIGAVAVVLRLPYAVIDALIVPLYVLTLFSLGLVLLTPAINGSHRWFGIGSLTLQPSEFAKLITILLVSKMITKPHISEARMLLLGFGITIMPVLLIIIEPDFGTTLVFWVSLLAMFVAAELPIFYLLLMISPIISLVLSFNLVIFFIFLLLFIYLLIKFRLSWVMITLSVVINVFIAIITPVIWQGFKVYQQNRILTFLDPTRDPLGAGYQIIQAKIAIGSGQLAGKGFLLGTQKNMNFLPEHHTDFIFSVVGEEFGLIGGLCLLFLFFLFIWRIISSIDKISIPERRVMIAGIAAYLSFQVFVNIGMNIGVVPTTGIPLPFISKGGTNLMINSMAIGMILKFLNERGFIK